MARFCLADSSGDAASLLLAEDDRIIAQNSKIITHGHGKVLPMMMQELCQQTAWPIASFDFFVVINGPGGFTGLRAGMAFMAGMACAAGKSVMGVDSCLAHLLSAQAHDPSPQTHHIWRIVVNSRRLEKYYQDFSRSGQPISPLLCGKIDFSMPDCFYAGDGGADCIPPATTPISSHWGHAINLAACMPFVMAQTDRLPTTQPAQPVPNIIYHADPN